MKESLLPVTASGWSWFLVAPGTAFGAILTKLEALDFA